MKQHVFDTQWLRLVRKFPKTETNNQSVRLKKTIFFVHGRDLLNDI